MIELHFNNTVLQVQEDDSSFCYNSIELEQSMTLKFSVAEPLDIPVGAWCVFNGVEYTLLKPDDITKSGTRNLTYTLLLNGPFAKSGHYKVRNTVDRRLKFSMCARPKELLQLIVDNLNMRDGGWSVGTCIDSTEKTIAFNHVFINEALQNIIKEFDTEGEIVGKVINLGKVEYFKDDPLPLSYGKGNGFKPGVGRMNTDDDHPVEILFVQGGNRNIDASKYGSADLLLPAGQELEYEGRVYIVDEDGYSIRRKDKAIRFGFEDSFDGSEIYPSRVGTVSSVIVVDEANNFYDIVDDSIPDSLNYRDCRIAGETMTIKFQSGMLAGKEFEIKQTDDALTGYDPSKKRFELVPTEIDGITMPSGVYVPRAGDTYAVFGCMLPDAYVRDDETKSGASWDMFRDAARYMYEHEDFRFTFTGGLSALWTKRNWLRVGGRLRIGSYIRFSDVAFVPDGVDIRITGIKTYLNAPYSPTIEISNSVAGSRVNSALKKAENAEVIIEDKYRDAIQFTKRRFRDSKETIAMLEDALLENFSSSVNPLSVQTMAMLIGDESLQYQFVSNMENPTVVPHNVSYDLDARVLYVPAGIIQHMTLGISTLSSSHKVSEYRFWSLGEYVSPVLNVADKKYYLYAKVGSTSKVGEFLLSETAIGMKEVSGYYHLLVGVLNSEYDGERSYVSLYGFSEVLPGRITTDRVVSADGLSFFDLLNDAFKLHDKLQFNVNGDGKFHLKGTLVQNEGGFESALGVYRGVYGDEITYFPDDRAQYDNDGVVSTYTYINKTPGKGHNPTDPLYWRVDAAGTKGKDGTSVKVDSTLVTYQKSKSGTVIPSGTWENNIPATVAGDYLWTRTIVNYSDGKSTTSYSVSAHGANGTSITIKSHSVTYAVTAGTNQPADSAFTTDQVPSVGQGEYLWSKTVVVYSDNTETKSYSVSRVGTDGANGTPGAAGADGRTSYLHMAYANNNTGTSGFSLTPFEGAQYLGTCTDHNQPDPTDPSAYKWVLFKGTDGKNGEDGKDGVPGEPGADGRTSYFHVKYSAVANPTAAQITDTPSAYIGTYVDFTEASSTDPTKYKWMRWEGQQGIPGENGDDGKTTYLHIKYSNDGGGTFTTGPGMRLGIGISMRLLGDGGIKFLDSPDAVMGGYLGESPGDYIGMYHDDKPDDSNDPNRYTWTKIKGDDGQKGDTGDFYEHRYQKNGSTSVAPSIVKTDLIPVGWTTVMPEVGALEYLWFTTAKKSGDGETLLSEWSTPVRMTPHDGKDGAQGESPVLVYRGIYDPSKTYYGNNYRLDAVKHNGTYNIARIDAGAFYGIAPTDKTKWNDFGAQFESIATNLLLAENANLANLIFRNQRLESAAQTNGIPNFFLDGLKNIASFAAGSVVFDGASANIGWLKVIDRELLGFDNEGLIRLRMTPNALPSAGGASTREDVNIIEKGGEASFIPDNNYDVRFEQRVHLYYGNPSDVAMGLNANIEFNVTEDSTQIELGGVRLNCKVNRLNSTEEVLLPCSMLAYVSRKVGSTWVNIGTLNLNDASTTKITIPTAGRVKIDFSGSAVPDGYECTGTFILAVQTLQSITAKSEMIIAKDGVMAIYNANYMRMHSTDGFTVMIGNKGFRVTANGLQKTTDGTRWYDV